MRAVPLLTVCVTPPRPQPPPPGGGGGWDRLFVLDVWILAFFVFVFFVFARASRGKPPARGEGNGGNGGGMRAKRTGTKKGTKPVCSPPPDSLPLSPSLSLSSPALGGRASRRRRRLRAPAPAQFHSKHTTHTTHTHTPLQKKETHARKHTPLSSLFFVCVCGRMSTSRTGARSRRAAAPPTTHTPLTPSLFRCGAWGRAPASACPPWAWAQTWRAWSAATAWRPPCRPG